MDFKNMFKMEDVTEKFDGKDINDSKVLSLFSYLGILILIPILACKDSKFAKFHADQGIKYLIFSTIFGFAIGIVVGVVNVFTQLLLAITDLGILGILLFLIAIVFYIIIFALSLCSSAIGIIGIINAVTGKAKKLPIIGALNFTIIKYE